MHCNRKRLLRRGHEFHVCTINKSAYTKKVWKPIVVWSIPYVSVGIFPSLKQNFIAYRSSKVADCIFEIDQLWQSVFSRVYSNCFCGSSFETEIIKIGQSSHMTYSNNILNFQESTTILNSLTKKSLKTYRMHLVYIYIYICIYIYIIRLKNPEGRSIQVECSMPTAIDV